MFDRRASGRIEASGSVRTNAATASASFGSSVYPGRPIERDDGTGVEGGTGVGVAAFAGRERGQHLGARAGPVGELVVGAIVQPGGPRVDDDECGAELLGGPPNAQIQRRVLLFEVGAPDEHGLGGLEI